MAERNNPDGPDESFAAIGKASPQDITFFKSRLNEMDGVEDLVVMNRARERPSNHFT